MQRCAFWGRGVTLTLFKLNYYISATFQLISMKFGRMTHIDLLTLSAINIYNFKKFKMADSHLESR